MVIQASFVGLLTCLVFCSWENVNGHFRFWSNNEIFDESLESLSEPREYVDPGEPLFLTPLIKAGHFDEAKNKSRVGPLNGTNIVSYSGFLTVNPVYNSNLFFWFIPSLNNPKSAPVLLWLQGGPGASSLFGLFAENGPFRITPQHELYEANYTWSSMFSMLYFDNPVGTGFSFTRNDSGYARNEDDIARDLYEALTQFFTLFSEYGTQDFYATGESYAGKYVPAISHKIDTENPHAEVKINLKGVAIGDGFIDPKSQSNYADFLYNIGLLDDSQRLLFLEQQYLAIENIDAGNFLQALQYFSSLVLGADPFRNITYFQKFTGLQNIYNFLLTDMSNYVEYYHVYVKLNDVRRSIHVGNQTFDNGQKTQQFLQIDIMNSTKSLVENLLNSGYKVLLYSGQVDICVAYPLTENLIKHLNWSHADEYQTAERIIWKVHKDDMEIAGYEKKVYNFQEIVVRNAGHMVPHDQPRAALDMISRFVFDKPF